MFLYLAQRHHKFHLSAVVLTIQLLYILIDVIIGLKRLIRLENVIVKVY